MHKEKGSVVVWVFIVFSLLIIGGLFYKNSVKFNTEQVALKNNEVKSNETSIIGKQILTDHILNFGHLQLKDLPNFVDVRGVYPYKNNLIITGIDQIVEYNPSTKSLLRVLDRSALHSVYSTALIDKNLYIATKGESDEDKTWVDSWARIYQVDLESGKITKQYFGNPAQGKRHINLYLASKDNYLWTSSYDGIFRIDVLNGRTKVFDQSKLTLSPECVTQIFNKENSLFGFVNCYGKFGKLIYDEASDTWSFLEDQQMSRYINLRLKDFNLDLPTYSNISNEINGKYYLFADKGIYTLSRNEFPKMLNKIDVTQSFNNYLIHVTKDEKYAFSIGNTLCGPDLECETLTAILIELLPGTQTDLLKNSEQYMQMIDDQKNKIIEILTHSKIVEEGNRLNVVNVITEEIVATFSIDTEKLIFDLSKIR